LTVLNTVPGLICIVLMIRPIHDHAVITKEPSAHDENLLAMPVRPIEVMLAKIVPYIFIGYVQVLLILAPRCVFQLPINGSVPLLLFAIGLFMASNLALGITFSTLSENQIQAVSVRPVHAAAVVPVVGFHVSFQRHAGLGAMVAKSCRRPMRCASCAASC